MQALEESENLLRILRFDPNPIISHGEYAPAVPLVCSDVDTRNLLTAILDGVANQVLKQLGKPAFMDSNHRQLRGGDGSPGLLKCSPHAFQDLGEDARRIDVGRWSFLIFRRSRVREKILYERAHPIGRSQDVPQKRRVLALQPLSEVPFDDLRR